MTDLSASRPLTTAQTLFFAVAAAVMVANIYYAQPLLAVIARAFGTAPAHAGFLITMTQLGYGLGVLTIVPLGDQIDRRRLSSVMLCGCIAALIVTALSPSFAVFAAMQLLVGATACATMVVIPYVAAHSEPEKRGQRLGTVMTGLLLGILLARTVSGIVADLLGWRVMYGIAAGLVAVLLVVLRRTMRPEQPATGISYAALMRSLADIVRTEPEVRRRSIYAMLAMVSFSVLWTGLTLLLTAPPYDYGASTVGLFGLLGAAGALSVSFAGKLADRGLARPLTGILAIILVASWGLLAAGGTSMPFLVAGILVLDAAAQGLQVVHQSVIYKTNPEARSRITSVFVTAGFIGMAIGSALASYAFGRWGWAGVATVGAASPAILVVHWAFVSSVRRRKHRVSDRLG